MLLSWQACIINQVSRSARRVSFQPLVDSASKAAPQGDVARLLAITHRVGRHAPNQHKDILDKSGTRLSDSLTIDRRWAKHYCEALSAEVDLDGRLAGCGSIMVAPIDRVMPSHAEITKHLLKLSGDRCTGTDQLPA